MKSLVIIGRRWFQKTYGNTYHSVDVIVDGKSIGRVDFAYGYDGQYRESAKAILGKAGLLPGIESYSHGGTESLFRYCERKRITFTDTITDVGRKADL
jgi:hypothetical protein